MTQYVFTESTPIAFINLDILSTVFIISPARARTSYSSVRSVVVIIEVVERLSRWALGKVAVVRRESRYCTVLMHFPILFIEPYLTGEHALAADSTRRKAPAIWTLVFGHA